MGKAYVNNVEATIEQAHSASDSEIIYDPGSPVPLEFLRAANAPSVSGLAQRQRRSRILAAIRELLVERGFEGVTVRRIAEASGYAVQTIYNLVGPRDQAIVEAICEYTRLVNYSTLPDPEDPYAVVKIIDRGAQSIEASPEFCRQVCQIALTPSRDIFYRYRDRQFRAMRGFLAMQRKSGALRANVNISDLAEQLIIFASALYIDWADRGLPVEHVRRQLISGYANLIAGAINPLARALPKAGGTAGV